MLEQLNELAKNYEYLIKAIAAFLPFLIAIFMAYIAYQQWQTNERVRKKDLFEKRFKYYLEMRNIFESILSQDTELAASSLEDIYINDARGDLALFLFGKDMQNHIVELFEHKISSHDEFTKPFQKYLVIEKH